MVEQEMVTKKSAMKQDIQAEKVTSACFVCGKKEQAGEFTHNKKVMLPVCMVCKDTPEEKSKETELLDSLADGLFCGCI